MCIDADRFDLDVIRKKIHLLYRNKENLTLSKIMVHVHLKFNVINVVSSVSCEGSWTFMEGRTSLQRLLRVMGIKTVNNRLE